MIWEWWNFLLPPNPNYSGPNPVVEVPELPAHLFIFFQKITHSGQVILQKSLGVSRALF